MNIVKRKKNENFTTISNVFLRDLNLSIKGKGFLAVIMGLPDNWQFNIAGICSILQESKTAVYNVIDELRQKGYCKCTICRDDEGLITGNDYTFSEESEFDKEITLKLKRKIERQKIKKQQQCYQETANRKMDSVPQLSTNNNKQFSNNKDLNNILPEKEFSDDETNNVNKQKNKTFDVRQDLSYVNEKMLSLWNEWLDYKDDVKKQYKTNKGVMIAYKKLTNYSNNNVVLADAIIKNAIEKSYDGFFPLTDKQVDYFLSNNYPYNEKKKETTNANRQPTEKELRNNITCYPIGTISKCGRYKKITRNNIAEI